MSLTLAMLGDTLKFSTIGITAGAATGTAAEMLADELLLLLDIKRQEHGTSAFAEVLVRGAAAGMVFVLGNMLMRNVDAGVMDATEGGLFIFGFIASQPELTQSVRDFRVKAVASVMGDGQPCCDDCAHGKSCAGK